MMQAAARNLGSAREQVEDPQKGGFSIARSVLAPGAHESASLPACGKIYQQCSRVHLLLQYLLLMSRSTHLTDTRLNGNEFVRTHSERFHNSSSSTVYSTNIYTSAEQYTSDESGD